MTEIKTCPVCGKVYEAKHGQRTCSFECSQKLTVQVKCIVCGKEMTVKQRSAGMAMYCGEPCRVLARKARRMHEDFGEMAPPEMLAIAKRTETAHRQAMIKVGEAKKTDSEEMPEREVTPSTRYLCHKWHREGMTERQIGSILLMPSEQVARLLQEKITPVEDAMIERYLAPCDWNARRW